jgi:LmbE family N-acetylglucosaminyl deacetylase
VGNHVDHQLCRSVGLALLDERSAWRMPGPDWRGNVVFYEDFPYAWWHDFRRLEDLPAEGRAAIPAGLSLTPEYADIGDQLERKIRGISIYESQIGPLFGGVPEMATAVRLYGQKIGSLSTRGGSAERYWVATRY